MENNSSNDLGIGLESIVHQTHPLFHAVTHYLILMLPKVQAFSYFSNYTFLVVTHLQSIPSNRINVPSSFTSLLEVGVTLST